MYLLNILDEEGHFELIDSDFLHLYNLDKSALIEITDKQYEHYLSMIGDVTYKDGSFYTMPVQPSEAHVWNGKKWVLSEEKLSSIKDERLLKYITDIDSKAAEIYNIWTRFELEYTARRDAAQAYKDANYKGDPGIYVTSFALAAKLDNETATNIILQQADLLKKVQDDLAAIRMRKFELKQEGLTLEQLTSIYNDIMASMDELHQQYKDA